MTGYSIGLFVHVAGALALFMGIAVSRLAFGRVRRARSVGELRLWLGVARRTRVVFPASIVVLLASGLFLTAQSWSFTTPWVATSLVSVVALGVAGAAVNGRHGRAMGRALGDRGDGPLPADVTAQQRRGGPFVFGFALNGVALGVVFLMTTKPDWVGSVLGVLAGAVAGAAVGGLAVRRPADHPTPAGRAA